MRKMYYLMLMLLLVSTASLNAQVTIGSEVEPHEGAVLDLSTVSSKNLGLLLPQAKLTFGTVWSPVLGEKEEGMMVYNTGSVLPKGVYVWTVNDEFPDGFWAKNGAYVEPTCGANTLRSDGTTFGWLKFMCYNLGAEDSRKNPFVYDEAIVGDLYQWGRPKDGHQLRTSNTNPTLATSNTPGHDQFITTTANPYDWRSGGDSELSRWGDGTQDENPAKAANDPCPSGWKVPSQKQWALLLKEGLTTATAAKLTDGTVYANKWVWTGNGYKVGDALFLPAAGYRANTGAIPVTNQGFYWSSTIANTTRSYYVWFSNASLATKYGFDSRGSGESVRCVAE